ncbi:C10 family peptidase [bacterium]|nr:C10 family peptidase [bacterium]
MDDRLFRRLSLVLILIFCCHSHALAKPVDLQTAQQVAANMIFAKSRRQIERHNIAAAFTETVDAEAIYYTFNLPGGGWIIISADDVVHPVVGFSLHGSYSPQDRRPVQFDQWMENVKNQIQHAKALGGTPPPETADQWSRLTVSADQFVTEDLDYATVGPLLLTDWDQGTYYNELCPADVEGPGGHVWAGCVATAMAQVMKYHNFPETGFGTHSYTPTLAVYGVQSADFGNTTYDWDAMTTPRVTASNPAVATLLYHAGVSVDMSYAPDGSGASTAKTATALKSYFKYKNTATYVPRSSYKDSAEWNALLRTEINNGRPVIYRGSGTGGHAFVCDGYNNDSADNYFHFNWGWSGWYNGFFYLDALTPGSNDFTSDQAAVIGISPSIEPNLSFPYTEGFENTVIPEEFEVGGQRGAISEAEAYSGSHSLMLGTLDGTGISFDSVVLRINVPNFGARLSFWVKRGYNPAPSGYNDHRAVIKTQFGESILHSFYEGDFNDPQWKKYSLDLSPWAGSNINFAAEQDNSSSSYMQWTYLDDIKITAFGDINGSGHIDLGDVIAGLQVLIDYTPAPVVDVDADVNNDQQIGLVDVLFALDIIAGQ